MIYKILIHFMTFIYVFNFFRFGSVLIAAPATVLHQWVKEFHKWSPEFRVAILHDTGSFTGRKVSLLRLQCGKMIPVHLISLHIFN